MIGTIGRVGVVNTRGLLPPAVIVLVVAGKPDAIDTVLEHYDKQIDYLSSPQFRNEDGNRYFGTDFKI